MTLIEAVQSGDLSRVRGQLEAGADAGGLENGELPLVVAIDRHQPEIIAALLEFGADVDGIDGQGYTPVFAASAAKEPRILKSLLEKGARNLEAIPTGVPPWTALQCGCFYGHQEIVQLLLEAGADPNRENSNGQSPLIMAARHPTVVRLLLKHGADPNRRTPQGRSPLLAAASAEYGKSIRVLLSGGADPNVTDDEGLSPLLLAVQQKLTPPVRWLLQAGADPNITFANSSSLDPAVVKGGTALAYAARTGRTRIVAALLRAGARWDVPDERGNTALDAALTEGHEDIVQLLQQEAGPDLAVERTPEQFAAMLLQATKGGNLDHVRKALRNHADPNITDEGLDFGMTPLMHACALGRADLVETLVSAGAKINPAEPEHLLVGQGYTALHYAAEGGHANCVRLLLDAAADLEPYNEEGCTPLMLAAREGMLDAVRVLVEFGADPLRYSRAAENFIDDSDEAISDQDEFDEDDPEADASELDDAEVDWDEDEREEAMTALDLAAAEGHIAVLGALLESAASQSPAALRQAARHLQVEAVQLLLERGYAADLVGSQGETPLHEVGQFEATVVLPPTSRSIDERDEKDWKQVALERQMAVARLLLDAGADANAADIKGRTPLMAAAAGRTSLTRKTDPDEGMEVHDFAETDPSRYVRLLLDAGADPHARDSQGKTALHHAFHRDFLQRAASQVIRILIKAGVEIDAQDAAGQTPLMMAIKNEDLSAVKRLLRCGADVNVRDRGMRTALHYAAQSDRASKAIKLLVDAGANVDVTDSHDRSPLQVARDQQNRAAVRILQKLHASDRGKKENELAEAIEQDDLQEVRRLLDAGADFNQQVRRQNAFVRAVRKESAALVSELVRRGADVAQSDDQFRWYGRDSQAIHYAARLKDPELLNTLLQLGADPCATNRRGWTPVTVAAFSRQTANVQCLLEAGGRMDQLAEDFLELLSFSDQTTTDEYQSAVGQLTEQLGVGSRPFPWADGLVCWPVDAEQEVRQALRENPKLSEFAARYQQQERKRTALLTQWQARLLERGMFLVGVQSGRGCSGSSDFLALFPTTNPFALIAAMGVYGNDAEISCPQLVSMLRRLHEREPFDLLNMKNDALDIAFHELVRKPQKIAAFLYKICPDIIDQGVGSMKRLIECLETSRHVHFWWD